MTNGCQVSSIRGHRVLEVTWELWHLGLRDENIDPHSSTYKDLSVTTDLASVFSAIST